jgi:hypothetical protein
MDDVATILEYVYQKMLDAKSAEECRELMKRAIVLSKEHRFAKLQEEFGVIC